MNGQPEYMLCIVEDRTERRKHESALLDQQAELMALSDAAPVGLFRATATGEYTYVNLTSDWIAGTVSQHGHSG